MKRFILLAFLCLSSLFTHAQFVNDFTGQVVILPNDTTILKPTYFRKIGTVMYEDTTLFIWNGSRFAPVPGAAYNAGWGLHLSYNTFFVDTSAGKVATQSMLNDTAIKGVQHLADTALVLRTLIPVEIHDTAIILRTYTLAQINDTSITVRAYGVIALNDTASSIRSAIPSVTGFATLVQVGDTAIVLRGLIPIEINDSAINIRTYTSINLADTSTVLRGLIPSLSGYATTIAVADSVSGRTKYSDTSSLISTHTYTTLGIKDSVLGRIKYSDTATFSATESWVLGKGYGTGTVTSITAGTGLSGGTITTSGNISMPNVGTAGTYGSSSVIPVITTDAQGRVSGVSTATMSATTVSSGINTNVTGSAGAYTVNAIQQPIDTSVLFISQTYTANATSPSSGNARVYSNNQTGIDEIHVVPSVGAETILQNSIGQKLIGWNSIEGTSAVGYWGIWQAGFSSSGTLAYINKTYDGTNLLPNFSYYKYTTAASINSSAEQYMGLSQGSVFVGNALYGAGAKLVFTFSFPTYASTERIFDGFISSSGASAATTDPSTWLNNIGISKDAGQSTLYFTYNAGSGSATQVNTGVTPNSNNLYRLTIVIPSNTTITYQTLEVITKTGITVYTSTNTTKIPTAGTFLYPHEFVNTGSGGSGISLGIILGYCELY